MHVSGKPDEPSRLSQADLRQVYDHVPVMVCVLDSQRRLEYANQALCRFVGQSEQTLRGELACGLLGCIHSLDDPRGCGYGTGCETCALRLAILDTYDTGLAHRDIDYRATIERDGRREEMSFLGATALLQVGGKRSLVLCLEDITRQKKAEELHQQSEARYRQLLDASPCAILVVQDGRYVYGNPYALDRFGYSADELLQIPVLETIHPEWREQIRRRLGAIERGASNPPIQIKLLRKNGEVIDQESHSVPILFDGRLAALVIGLDITERKRAEERIRRLAELLDTSPTSITVHDREGRFLYANEQTFALHGCSREEFFGLNLRQLDVPASAEAIDARMAEIAERGAASFDVEHYRKDGTVVPLRVDARSARWGDQSVILSVVTDVSDLRRIQDALQDREARLRSILEAVSESLFLIDLDGTVLECNETTARRLGTSAAELRGRSIYDFLAARLVETRRRVVQRVIQTRQPVQFEDQRDERWIEHSVYPAFDAAGNIVQIAIFARDVTARKRTEEALRQSEEHFRVLAETMLQGVVHQDRDGTIIAMNPVAESILGKNADELLGSSSVKEEAFTIREDGSRFPGLEHPAMVALRTGQPVKGIVMGVFNPRIKDFRWISVDAIPLFRPGEQLPFQVYTIFADITDRRRSEQESRELERRLLHTQKLESLSVLAGGVAHDFNNILTAIGGYAELVQVSLPPAAPAQDDLEMIRQSVARAAELTRQMLAYSGKGRFSLGLLNLSSLVADCKSLLAPCVSKQAAVTYDLPLDLPTIQADPAQMRQLLMNLVVNASEALGEEPGQIAISARPVQLSAEELAGFALGRDRPAGLYVCLEIADTGCGMDEQTLARLFDPFFSTKFIGRGLGAPAVHGIVRGHRGAIEITTQPDRGTTFRVYLPAHPTTPDAGLDG